MSPLSLLNRGAYIVVANSSPQLLDMMVETLREQGHFAFRAYDGQAALDLTLALRRVDLLITDTNQPGLTGPQLVREVRDRLPTLPILYVKKLGSPSNPQDELPPDVPILAEPLTPEQFLAAIRPLLIKDQLGKRGPRDLYRRAEASRGPRRITRLRPSSTGGEDGNS